MNTTEHRSTSEPTSEPNAQSSPTPIPALLRAIDLATPLIAAAQAADPGLPTPCEAMPLGELLPHVLAVGERIVAMGQGHPASSTPDHVVAPDGDYASAWTTAGQQAAAAWAGLALDGPVTVPWREMTVAEAAAIYASEVVVHAWDLARSIGAHVAADDELVAIATAAMHHELPAEGRAEMFDELFAQFPEGAEWSHPFQAAVHTDAEASTLDRLVALTGRDPGWRP